MTTRYLDFTGGNDGNDGSTFALRKRTLASAVVGLTGGDTVRVMASAAATSLGQSATWTNASETVTLTSAVTLNITDCESAWTASANVTSTASTATFREGTKSANHVIAAGFTTGLASYFATGTLDLSSYQQVSFWIRSTGTHASGVFTLRLCTDTVGAVSVHTLTVPALTASTWTPVTVDNAGALNSAIASVALYCASDPGAVTVNIDNIIACKASSSADSLTLQSLISLNTDANTPWYTIRSINGTTIKLGCAAYNQATPSNWNGNYQGSTVTATTYKREPIYLAAVQTCNVAGTSGSSLLNIEGGWDTSAMSSQSDVTWVAAADPSITLMTTSSVNYNRWNKIYTAGATVGLNVNTSALSVVDDFAATGCGRGLYFQNSNRYCLNAGRFIVACQSYCIDLSGTTNYADSPATLTIQKLWGGGNNGTSQPICILASSSNGGGRLVMNIDEVKNGYYGFNDSIGWEVDWYGTTFANNAVGHAAPHRTARFFNCTGQTTTTTRTYFSKYGQTVDDHRVIFADTGTSTIASATDQRHTASDFSWKFSPLSVEWSSYYPMSLSLAKIACPSGEARTLSVWVRRDSTSLNMRLRLPGRQIAGVATDVTASASAAINTWEQISVTWTPTEAGVVEVFMDAWGGTTLNGWVDDLTVT